MLSKRWLRFAAGAGDDDSSGGGTNIVGASVNGGQTTGGTISVTRFISAGNYVAACARSNGGTPSITASGPGGLTLSQTQLAGLNTGVCTISGTYTFTTSNIGNVAAVIAVLEIAGVAGTKNGFITTNPGTFNPSPAQTSVAFAFMSDSNFTAFPSMTANVPEIARIQRGDAGNGFESMIVLAEIIPGSPGTQFNTTFVGASNITPLGLSIV